MRFHLIDRIDSYVAMHSVRARKLTSLSEEYWEESEGASAMPAPLILEALCQAGSWLIIISTERRQRAALLSIGEASFSGIVRPGDVLEIEGQVDSMGDEVAVLSGRITVTGALILEARDIMCVLIAAGDLEDLEDTGRMATLLTRSEGG